MSSTTGTATPRDARRPSVAALLAAALPGLAVVVAVALVTVGWVALATPCVGWLDERVTLNSGTHRRVCSTMYPIGALSPWVLVPTAAVSVSETGGVVTLTVDVDTTGEDACPLVRIIGSLTATLESPLGDRAVVDGSDGDEVALARR